MTQTATELATKVATTAAGATGIPFAGTAALGFISYGNMVVGSILDSYSAWQTQQALQFAKDPIVKPGQTPGSPLPQPSISPQPVEGNQNGQTISYSIPSGVNTGNLILDPSDASVYIVKASVGSPDFDTIILPSLTNVASFQITPLGGTA